MTQLLTPETPYCHPLPLHLQKDNQHLQGSLHHQEGLNRQSLADVHLIHFLLALQMQKKCKIIRKYARSHNLNPESETDINLPKKPKPGKLNIKDFVIKHRKPRKRVFKCLVCKHKGNTQAEQNMHIKRKHADFHFKCKHCPKAYQTFNGKWKHKKTYQFFKHKCGICKKRFQFPKGLR